jgi:hypothetical protein
MGWRRIHVNVAVVPVVTTSGGSAAFTAGDNTASTPVVVDGMSVTDNASHAGQWHGVHYR